MRRKQTGRGIEYHASDIAPLHPDAAPFSDVFTLECKNYSSIDLHQLFYAVSDKSTISKWWAQACRDAASVERWPLMVVKELRREPLVVLREPSSLSHVIPRNMAAVRVAEPEFVLVLLSSLLTLDYALFSHDYKIALPLLADHRPASHRKRQRLVSLGNL